jgi:DNA-binding XRE family transcriptional regulator
MSDKAFSLNLRNRRASLGLSQKALGEAISISRVSINHYETGKKQPYPTTLKKMCRFFKCTSTQLLGF